MAKKNLFQRIKEWFSGGGNNNNRGSSPRATSVQRTNSNAAFKGRPQQSNNEEDEKAKRQKKIQDAFAISTKAREKAREEDKKFKNINAASKMSAERSAEWKKTREEKGWNSAKDVRMAQLGNDYWNEAEKLEAKYTPKTLAFAKGAAAGATLNADKLALATDKKAKARQEEIHNIMVDQAGEKAINRSELAGELAGSLPQFAMGLGGAKLAVQGGAKSTQLAGKLAGTDLFKKAAARAIEKGAAKGTVEEVSSQIAKNFSDELLANAVVDNTMGVLDSAGRASAAEGDANEKLKEFAKMYGLNVGISGAITAAPLVVKGIKGAKSLERANKAKLAEEKRIADATKEYTVAGKNKPRTVSGEVVEHGDLQYGIRKGNGKNAGYKVDDISNGKTIKKSFKTREEAYAYAEKHSKRNSLKAKNVEEVKPVDVEANPEVKTSPDLNAEAEVKAVDEPKIAEEVAYEPRVNGMTKQEYIDSDEIIADLKNQLDNAATAEEKASIQAELDAEIKGLEEDFDMFPKDPAPKPTVEPKPVAEEVKAEPPTPREEVPTEPMAEAPAPKGAVAEGAEETAEASGKATFPGEEAPKEGSVIENLIKKLRTSNRGMHELDEKNFNFDEIAPAKDIDGEMPKRSFANAEELDAMDEAYEGAERVAQETGEHQTQTVKSIYRQSISEDTRREFRSVIDAEGVTEKELREGMKEQLKNDGVVYDTKFKRLSYDEMSKATGEAVSEDPRAVAEYLFKKMKGKENFNASDWMLATHLSRYGEEMGIDTARRIGHQFQLEYGNEVGRNFGAMGYTARHWGFLSPDQKQYELIKSFKRLSKDLGVEVEDLIRKVDELNEGKVGEIIARRGEDTGGYAIKEAEGATYTEVLIDTIIHTTDEETATLAKKLLVDATTNSMPPSLLNTMTAWRYFAMLGNPRTHIRNIIGNFIFYGVRGATDVVGTGMEKVFKSLGKIDYQTKAVLTPAESIAWRRGEGAIGEAISKNFDEDLAEMMHKSQGYASKDANKPMNGFADTEGLYNSALDNTSLVTRAVHKSGKAVGNALEVEDKVFVAANYKKAMMEFLKANGYGTEKANLSSVVVNGKKGYFKDEEALLQAARNYAKDNAVEATFRDFNEFSKWMSNAVSQGMKRGASGKQKALAISLNTVMPFTTTPVNIMARSFDYSPLGALRGCVKLAKAANGEECVKAVEKLTEGLTGSTVLGLGFYWGMKDPDTAGFKLVTNTGDDEEAKAYKRLGYQNYSLVKTDENGNGWSYSLDWMAPMAATLFTGAEIGKQLHNYQSVSGGYFDNASNMFTVLSRVIEPTLNMSMMQGVNNIIEGASQNDNVNGLSNVALAMAEQYFGSFIPTFLGSLNRSFSPYAYETVGTSESDGGNAMQYWFNSQVAKIPGLSKALLPEKVDQKGNVVDERKGLGDVGKRLALNNLSPGNFKKIEMSDADRQAFKTYEEAIADGVDPDTAKQVFAKVDYSTTKKIGKSDKKYGLKKEDIKIDGKERATYLKDRSKNGEDALAAVLDSKAWNGQFSDKDKREARRAELKAMTFKSTDDVLSYLVKTPEFKNASASEQTAMYNAVLDKGTKYSANRELYMNKGHTKAEYEIKEDLPARIQAIYRDNTNGLADLFTPEELVAAYNGMTKISYGKDGTKYKSNPKKQMYAYFETEEGKKLSSAQKEAMFNSLKAWNAKPYGSGSGSGGRRRGGSSSSSKSKAVTPLAKQSAFKVSVKDSDYKSLVSGGQKYGKVDREFGLTDAQMKALVKKKNRASLKVRSKK